MTREELKIWRVRRGYSKVKACELFGVRVLQYARWELGKAPIPEYVNIILDLRRQLEHRD